MATVSFIVTTYQKAPYVEELVASLADHGVPGGAELVIADDASPDGTVPALQSAFARHGAWFDKACLLVADRNSGPTHALNAAVASASGRYLHFVDGDDRLPAGAALAMAKTALAGAGLVYGGKRLFQGAEARDCFEPAAAVWSHAPLSRLARQKLVGIRFLAEREAVIAGGGADTSIFVQDVSLPLRIAARVDR